ncbi:MAG: peptidase M23 [Flavobacteriaceae bacterium TMED120]|nr:MAG: peptidase M23 [Flavobacteriaceae bacterium TMED120]
MLVLSPPVLGQENKTRQQELEAQRQRLQKEIKQINRLLYSNRSQRKSAVGEVEDLEVKLNVRQRLIQVSNQQANYLTQRITINEKEIDRLRKEVQQAKEDYAKMIQESYKSQSEQNRLMFLFSSENLLQAYKRIQYMKQYARFRKRQAVEIAEKTVLLQDLNTTLIAQREQKKKLISENRVAQQTLKKERRQQQSMIQQLRRKSRSLTAQIRKKQQQSDAIDQEIQRLIREAIAASNKKAGKKTKATFAMTPDEKLIASNMEANRGRLPWPVVEGVITQRFGTQPHPVVRTTMIKSTGITIATAPESDARAVFEGEVMSILSFKGSNPTVLVKHGNYITAYKNLGKVYVKKGDKIKTKQAVGQVFTNPVDGKTSLQFSLFQASKPQNPKLWLARL